MCKKYRAYELHRLDIEMAKLTDAVGAKFGGAEEREKSLKEAFKVSKQLLCQVGG